MRIFVWIGLALSAVGCANPVGNQPPSDPGVRTEVLQCKIAGLLPGVREEDVGPDEGGGYWTDCVLPGRTIANVINIRNVSAFNVTLYADEHSPVLLPGDSVAGNPMFTERTPVAFWLNRRESPPPAGIVVQVRSTEKGVQIEADVRL